MKNKTETNQSLMETVMREQWRRGGKVTPVKRKKNGKNSKSMNASNRRDAGFSRGEEGIGSTEEGGGNSGVGPLHQFARDAAVYLTNDQILYAKKSTTGRGGMYSPSLHSRRECVYIYYIYICIYTPFSTVFRIHFTWQPRARLARHPRVSFGIY